jgi:hypothetical protein
MDLETFRSVVEVLAYTDYANKTGAVNVDGLLARFNKLLDATESDIYTADLIDALDKTDMFDSMLEGFSEIIDLISYNENSRGTFEGVSETLYEEDSDSFDETYKAETIEYRDHFINIETFDDQGDIVYVWSITSKKDNNTFSDEKYYNSIKSALDNAKAEIDFKIDGIKPIIASEPKCPYCGRKVNRDGLFYYSCIEHGKIHKNNIKK